MAVIHHNLDLPRSSMHCLLHHSRICTLADNCSVCLSYSQAAVLKNQAVLPRAVALPIDLQSPPTTISLISASDDNSGFRLSCCVAPFFPITPRSHETLTSLHIYSTLPLL